MRVTSAKQSSPKPGFRRRRAYLSDHWFRYTFPSEDGGVFEAFVSRDVLDFIDEDTRRWGNLETIGWLAGRVLTDDQGIYVYVTSAASAPDAIRERCYVATTPSDDAFLASLYRDKWADLDKLGWWHSHPNLGLTRYSGTDFANQDLWCGEAYQIGLLVACDGGKSRVVGFSGPECQDMGIRAVKNGSEPFEPVSDGEKTRQETELRFYDDVPAWDKQETLSPDDYKDIAAPVRWQMLQAAVLLVGGALKLAVKGLSRIRTDRT